MKILLRAVYLISHAFKLEFGTWLHPRLDINLKVLILSLNLAGFIKRFPLDSELLLGSIKDPKKNSQYNNTSTPTKHTAMTYSSRVNAIGFSTTVVSGVLLRPLGGSR